jgi:hypothetical protein
MIAAAIVSHQTIGVVTLLYQLRYILEGAGDGLSARDPSVLLQVLLNVREVLTPILYQAASHIMVSLAFRRQAHLLSLIELLLAILLLPHRLLHGWHLLLL